MRKKEPKRTHPKTTNRNLPKPREKAVIIYANKNVYLSQR
jgi:hypothetical protein